MFISTRYYIQETQLRQVTVHDKSPRDVALNFLRVPIDLALVRQGHRPDSRHCKIAFRILFRLPTSHLLLIFLLRNKTYLRTFFVIYDEAIE